MTPTGYSRTQITLHWSIAILIVAQFVLHDDIVAAWQAIGKDAVPDISALVMFHVIGGSIIFGGSCCGPNAVCLPCLRKKHPSSSFSRI